MKEPKKFTLRYSKKEKDIIANFPDNNGCILSGFFFDMFKEYDKSLKRDFMKIIENLGYDSKSLRITLNKKQ